LSYPSLYNDIAPTNNDIAQLSYLFREHDLINAFNSNLG